MDWTQALVIILSLFTFCGGGFMFLISKIDKVCNDLTKEIQKNREDILWIKWRIDPHEHHHWKSLEDDGKENKKGD